MSDPAEVVITQRQGPVLTVTMNRPKVLNVLDEAMADALVAAFSGLAADQTIRAVILAGAGRSFMAGGDLSRFQADLPGAPQTATLLIDRFHTLMRLIKAMPQPVIAAVQGPVAGGGVGLALACDLVVAAQDASFLSAYTKLGTNPDGGTTWTLTQLLGPRRALEFVLLNEAVNADTALQLGRQSRRAEWRADGDGTGDGRQARSRQRRRARSEQGAGPGRCARHVRRAARSGEDGLRRQYRHGRFPRRHHRLFRAATPEILKRRACRPTALTRSRLSRSWPD